MSVGIRDSGLHLPTIIAISVVVWTSLVVLHELGHGVACVLVGGDLRAISTTDLFCDRGLSVSFWGDKFINIAGPIANVIFFAASLALLKAMDITHASIRFALVLMLSASLFHLGGYMAVAGFFGDWSNFASGFDISPLLVIVVTLIGHGLIALGVLLTRPFWEQLWGPDQFSRSSKTRLLTITPLVAMLGANIVAAVLSPLRIDWAIFIAVLALVPLIWIPILPFLNKSMRWYLTVLVFLLSPIVLLALKLFSPDSSQITADSSSLAISRSIPWLVIGAIALVIYIAAFGPGIGSFEGYGIGLR